MAGERARLRTLAQGLGERENEREDRDEEGDLLVGGIDVDVGFGHSDSPLFSDARILAQRRTPGVSIGNP